MDIYHFDHYMGKFSNRLGELMGCSGIQVRRGRRLAPAALPGRLGAACAAPALTSHAHQCLHSGRAELQAPRHAQVGPSALQPDGSAVVPAQVLGGNSGQPFSVVFTLVQRELGRKKGCWMTKSLAKAQQ